MSPKVLWDVVRAAAARAGIDKLAPHDLRRTCARLCHLAGGELDQIQFLLGHVSIQTTERYLGCKQNVRVMPLRCCSWSSENLARSTSVLAAFHNITTYVILSP